MDKRLKKMTAIFFLAAAADLFLAAVLLASLARQRAEGAAACLLYTSDAADEL